MPAITSDVYTTFNVGTAGDFPVTTTGFPTPTLSESGTLPSGVTFTDNGDGTAALAGTPATGAGGVYDVTLTATNGVGSDATQNFAVDVEEASSIFSAASTTFTAGQSGTFTVETAGYPTAAIALASGSLPSGVTFGDNGDGTATLAGTPAAGTGGAYNLNLTATNGLGSGSQSFGLTVDEAPAITSDPAAPFTVGNPGAFAILTTGFPAATVTESGTLPSGITFTTDSDGTPELVGTANAGTAGNYDLTFTADNGVGADATQNFTLVVGQVPAITSADNGTFAMGSSGTFQVTTLGYPTATISESGTLPAGVSFVDNGDGTATLSGTPDAGSAGLYGITLTASNGTSPNATQSFILADSPILLDSLSDQTNLEGDSASIQLIAVDATGGSPTFSATGLPSGISIDASSGEVSGILSAGTASSNPYTVTVTATDGAYSDGQTFDWTVSPRISMDPIVDQSNVEGDSVTLQVLASSPDNNTLAYSATGLPSGLSIDPQIGLITGTISAGDAANGPYQTTVTATDGTYSGSQTFNWDVAVPNPITITNPGDQSNLEGQVVFFQLAASDSSSGTLTYSAANLPSGILFDPNAGILIGTIAQGDAAAGPYDVTITATDGTNTNSISFGWEVTAANPVFLSSPGDQSNLEGDAVALQLSGGDASGGTLTYSASGLPAGLSIDSGSGLISGTVSAGAAASGPYSITITDTDGTNSASQNFDWDVSQRIAVSAIADQQNVEGDTVSLQVAATSPDGNTLTYSADALPTGLSINSASGMITGTVSVGAAADGPYQTTVTASDGTYSGSQTFNWTVTAANPVSVTLPADQTNIEGDTVSVQVVATDANGNTLTYTADGLPNGLGIDSGSGVISGTIAAGASEDGPYTVTVTASDGTASASQVFTWNVAREST